MGDIYLKVSLSDINKDNYKNYNFKQLDRTEIQEISSNPVLRDLVLMSDLDINIQASISNYGWNLSVDDCVSIMKHSEHVWGNIIHMHVFTSEVLLEYGYKLDLFNIERQENITPEFVKKYKEHMDLGSFISIRSQNGDIEKFLSVPEIAKRYIRDKIHYRTSYSEIESLIFSVAPQADVHKVKELLDSIYHVQIDKELLIKYYSDRANSSNTVDAVVEYFTSGGTSPVYPNWEAYIAGSEAVGRTSLVNIWFNDHIRIRIATLIAENIN